MTGNPTPWIVIAAIVLVALYFKGHLKLPATKPANVNLPGPTALAPSGPAVDVDGLVKLGSYVLGLAFAKAVRIEAESSLAGKIARDAGEAIHKQFTDPFSVPAPAGPNLPGGTTTLPL